MEDSVAKKIDLDDAEELRDLLLELITFLPDDVGEAMDQELPAKERKAMLAKVKSFMAEMEAAGHLSGPDEDEEEDEDEDEDEEDEDEEDEEEDDDEEDEEDDQ